MSYNKRQRNEHKQNDQNLIHRQVDKYDGQAIWIENREVYEIGNYLGGGASGSVYQATDLNFLPTERQVAIKILNPVGFKLFPINQMNKCDVLRKGLPLTLEQHQEKAAMVEDNIWWLHHSSSHQILAAYEDLRTGQLRELTLPKCVEVWGWAPFGERDNQLSSDEEEKYNISSSTSYTVNGVTRPIPRVAPKFLKWLRSRQGICREMGSMMQIGEHRNIIKLYEILELIQDSKTTLFLVLELVTGGELFERMKVGQGNSEVATRNYFKQLLSGIEFCHERGVCHRDLKPENLLLSDSSDNAILKIADFGLSAVIFAAVATENSFDQQFASQTSLEKFNEDGGDEKHLPLDDLNFPGAPVKRLRSVVGSPHYVAPEITDGNSSGYDGRKADMWSAGVILYGLLTGSLPFGRDLSACPRFKRFKKWIFTEYVDALQAGKDPLFPSFLFPNRISPLARLLIVQLLHPDPILRLSATDSSKHCWFNYSSSSSTAASSSSSYSSSNLSRLRNVRIDENPNLGSLSRQPSPNSSKVSGKPPRPSSGNNSPTQISSLCPPQVCDSSKYDCSIPSLSRNSSNNDLPFQQQQQQHQQQLQNLPPGYKTNETKLSPNHSTTSNLEFGQEISLTRNNLDDDDDEDDEDDEDPLDINSSGRVVCVEDDGDYCPVEDSIWKETESLTLSSSTAAAAAADKHPNFPYAVVNHHPI